MTNKNRTEQYRVLGVLHFSKGMIAVLCPCSECQHYEGTALLTVSHFEAAEDHALGRHSFDVGVVLQGEQAAADVLPDLHHLKVTGVIASRIVPPYDAPVHRIHISQGAADEITARFGCEVSIKCNNVL